jgi:N-acetyl-anhydromuramyl-L-alanine amidase AmpD
MAQSTEYPDLKWVAPKSWTNANRSTVQCVVIHMTEGSANSNSAEDGAAYDARRTDGTSTHYFHDSNTTIQCVRTEDQAHAARTQGNRRGIQHELCGRGGTIDWTGAYGTGVLEHAAKQVARDCRKWDIPARKISASQLAAGTKGICGHVDVTNAFPQDNGTHTDPGTRFPWSRFISMVQQELAPKEEDTVTKDDIQAIAAEVVKQLLNEDLGKEGGGDTVAVALQTGALGNTTKLVQRTENLNADLAEIKTALKAASGPAIK